MIDLKLYIGKVVSTQDPEEKSRIKVRLLPEMADAQEGFLPWVYPFMLKSMTSDSYSHEFPEEDSLVWCFFTSNSFHTGFYISAVFLEDVFDYSVIENTINNIEEINNPTYPQAQFSRYADGTVIFRNITTGETGIYHSSGTYTVIDDEGSVFVKGVKDIKLYNENAVFEMSEDGTVELSNDSGAGNTFTITDGTFQFNGSGETLVKFSQLKTILGAIFQLYDTAVYTDPLSGVAGPIMVPNKPTFDSQIDLAEADNMEIPSI